MNKKKNFIGVSLMLAALVASNNVSFSADRYVNDIEAAQLSDQKVQGSDISSEKTPETSYGGGLLNTGSIYAFRNNQYTNNKAQAGGGIYNSGLIQQIDNLIMKGNSSVGSGGAIVNQGTMNTLTGTFENNIAGVKEKDDADVAGNGGAIYNVGDSTGNTPVSAIIDSINATFTANSAENGGAIYNEGQIGSIAGTFTNNIASDMYGGAIYNEGTSTDTVKLGQIDKLTGTYTGNYAKAGGGAVYNNGNIDDISATFTGNGTQKNKDTENLTPNGGALYNSGTIGNLHDTTFSGNKAAQNGGAIANTGTIASQGKVSFDSNSAAQGGAVYNEGTYNLSRYANFSNNSAASDGGALFNTEKGTVTSSDLSNQTFSGNKAGKTGGAIYNQGTMTLGGDPSVYGGDKNSVTFTGNEAGEGGAIYNDKNAKLTVAKGYFKDNKAVGIDDGTGTNTAGYGGAVANNGTATISDSSFENNTAASGGALANYKNGTMTLKNTSFKGNSAVAVTNDADAKSEGLGGAVENSGTLNISESSFENNTAEAGGAIINVGTIENLNASFNNNSAKNSGGAVANTGKINSIGGSFTNNNVTSTAQAGMGGAIYNHAGATTGDINADFTGNNVNVSYDEETSGGLGGAIGNIGTTGNVNGNFTSNYVQGNISKDSLGSSSVAGGAIANISANNQGNITLGTMGNITGNFKSNSAFVNSESADATDIMASGGAIYNNGKLGDIKANFDSNSAYVKGNSDTGTTYAAGGAVANNSSPDTSDTTLGIKSITGAFTNNTVSAMESDGGAIFNTGKIGSIKSDFSGNKAASTTTDGTILSKAFGGAIANMSMDDKGNPTGTAVIDSIDGNFTGNSASAMSAAGGAIYNAGGRIKSINGRFEDNSVNTLNLEDPFALAASGGAIANISGNIDSINADFVNNKAEANISGDITAALINGGAIYNNGTIGKISGNFTGNNVNLTMTNTDDTKTIITGANGGAIYNGGTIGTSDNNASDGIINSNFTGNYAKAQNADAYGGAIYNDSNIANEAGNTNILKITDSNFTGNKAIAENGESKGGAIYVNSGNVDINARNANVLFEGNEAAKGADIYIANNASNVNLNAPAGRNIAFNSGIAGQGTINVNKDGSTGTILFNSAVTPDGGDLTVNIANGAVKASVDNYLDGTKVALSQGALLDIANGSIGTMNLKDLTSDNGNIKLDMDFANADKQWSDIITAETASGTLALKDVNIMSDMADGTNKLSQELKIPDNLVLKTIDTDVNALTNDYLYTITVKDKTLSADRYTGGSDAAVKMDGFTLAVNQTGNVGGKDITVNDDRSFSASKDIEITGENIKDGWTGKLGGKNLTVYGNGHTLHGAENKGITIGDGQSLNFEDTLISGFKTSEDTKGALSVNGGGNLNISAINHDVAIANVTAGEKASNDAIYLGGDETTPAIANLTTANQKKLLVYDNISSANKANEVNLKGDGIIGFRGTVNNATITNANANTIHDNYVNSTTYNLKSGIVGFSKEAYLNGNGDANKNSLVFDGGTLNLMNGATGAVNLAELSLNSNSNIMVDADLAGSKMDTLSADKVNAIADGVNLNVSGINLLSDATKENTTINFVSDETLKSHVTSSVSNVAYSPIYKYGVDYNQQTGDFSFSRGSSQKYDNVNPSVMVAPVAAQLGGYFTQLNTYDQAFANMDMTMLMTKEQRQALKMYNKYAYSGGSLGNVPSFSGAIPEERAGGWMRPYTSFESVPLKNGPKVSNVMYGSYFGGDSSIKELGNGFDGVFSLYAGYNGSHQTFNHNSLWQNGGSLGATGTLYKGNWFGGWTVAGGLSGVDATTMYGSENFGMWSAGTALKTGYNFELANSKFIIQPHLMASYSIVDTFNYTNAAALKIHSDPLNAVQIVPGLKFVGNLKNGWQPYAGVDFIWNIMDKTKFSANDVSLPELSVKPYIQYGVGVQKRWGDRFTGYLQAMFRGIGRNGVIFSFGFRSMFGHGK